MQVIFKSDRYNTIGGSMREYKLNTPIEMSAEELRQVKEQFKDVPDLQIMERSSHFSKEDTEQVTTIVAKLKGQHPEAQESILQRGFEELPKHLRQELKLQASMAVELADDVRRNLDRLLENVAVWDRAHD